MGGALAFNPGVFHRILSMTPHQDFVAGEIDDPASLQIKRRDDGLLDGVPIQMLSRLGEKWARASRGTRWSRSSNGAAN